MNFLLSVWQRETNRLCLELASSLTSLGKICWMRLERETVRFTIIPDQGTQVWAALPTVSLYPFVRTRILLICDNRKQYLTKATLWKLRLV